MKINFYNPQAFEPWDFRNTEIGIGGSETCMVEMSRRLSTLGHDVTCYAHIPDPKEVRSDGKVEWYHTINAHFSDNVLWIIFRSPETADCIPEGTKAWHVSQDVVYFENCGGEYTEERCDKFDRIIGLCPAHCEYLIKKFSYLDGRVYLSSNGISSDRIKQLEKVERDQFSLIWSSSPDRGLEALVNIFLRAREYEERLKLNIFYGFDNLDKVIAKKPDGPQAKFKRRIMRRIGENPEKNGIYFYGRIGQTDLWKEYLKSSIWCYPTTFQETSCISCMEAAALGCIPITNPIWALQSNVQYGILIEGDPLGDKLIQSRYVSQLVNLAKSSGVQKQIRNEMISWALLRFDWTNIAKQWNEWILEYEN